MKKNKITDTPVSEDSRDARRSIRKKEDKIVRKITLSVLSVILIVGGILFYSTYNYINQSLKPLNPKSAQSIEVVIPNGSSNKVIGSILEKKKVIKSGIVFNYFTKFNNLTDFRSGTYHFSPNMSLEKISEDLQKGKSIDEKAQSKVLIPEGYSIDQIADAVEKNTKFSKNDFLTLISDPEFFQSLLSEYPELLTDVSQAKDVRFKLEGYLFPATYDIYDTMDLKGIVTEMIKKTNTVLLPYYEQIKQKQLTVHEVLTLASLVEKEGVKDDDRKNIAQVFFNRIKLNMPLQSDISILYALGEHKKMISIEETKTDSPYNLYVNTGYGPGPFDNPSEQAIKAVINPTDNDYIYFVADLSTGKVYFAKTYEEHLVNKEKYVDNQ